MIATWVRRRARLRASSPTSKTASAFLANGSAEPVLPRRDSTTLAFQYADACSVAVP